MHKIILFDADGVVINPPMQFSRHLTSAFGITPQMTGGFFQGVFDDCLLGKAELADVLPPYLKQWNWPGTTGDFIKLWMEKDDCPDPRLLKAIQKLRQAGILCGLATLQERNRAEYMRTTMRFSALFDHLFFSSELGCLKLEHEFYRQIEAQLALPGEAILFWDDREKNVTAARECGWSADLYRDFEDFEQKLKRYLP